jgi:putative peptidoglycan lipid II flippase
MLALCLPAAALLAVGVRPLLARFFGYEAAQLDLVTWFTWAFLFGLVGDTWLEVAVRSFYANQNTRTPLLAALGQALAFILLAWLLSGWIGLPGIPLAAAIAYTAQAIVLLTLLNRKFPGLLKVGGTALRALPSALLAGALAWAGTQFLPLPAWLAALAGMSAGGLAALPLIWPEARLLFNL